MSILDRTDVSTSGSSPIRIIEKDVSDVIVEGKATPETSYNRSKEIIGDKPQRSGCLFIQGLLIL